MKVSGSFTLPDQRPALELHEILPRSKNTIRRYATLRLLTQGETYITPFSPERDICPECKDLLGARD